MEGNKVYAVISKLEDFVNFCRDENLNLNKIDWTATSTGGDKYVAVNRIERIYGLIFDSIIEIYFNSPNLEFYRLRYELSKRELKEKAKDGRLIATVLPIDDSQMVIGKIKNE